MNVVKKSSIVTRKNKINNAKEKKFNISYKWINISMFFCLSGPLIFLAYLYVISIITKDSILNTIFINTQYTLAFIISMLGILCAHVCNRSIKTLKYNGDENSIKRNLIIIAISQGLMANIFGAILMVLAIIKTFKIKSLNDIKIKEIFKSKVNLDFIFSLLILSFSSISLILIINIY